MLHVSRPELRDPLVVTASFSVDSIVQHVVEFTNATENDAVTTKGPLSSGRDT